MSEIIKKKIKFTENNIKLLSKKFYSFDVETTGLNPVNDRIIEIGCCEFVNLQPVKIFQTLINAHHYIPHHVTKVNNITNEMLKEAPLEDEVYLYFCQFIKDVLDGRAIIVAHNATFDMNFLSNTLERLNISGKLYYIDTLELSRCYLNLCNNKQTTVANYFNIPIGNAHRAGDDALVCGKILSCIINLKSEKN